MKEKLLKMSEEAERVEIRNRDNHFAHLFKQIECGAINKSRKVITKNNALKESVFHVYLCGKNISDETASHIMKNKLHKKIPERAKMLEDVDSEVKSLISSYNYTVMANYMLPKKDSLYNSKLVKDYISNYYDERYSFLLSGNNKNISNMIDLTGECMENLKEENKTSYGKILGSILVSLTGVGFLVGIGQLAASKGKKFLFFNKNTTLFKPKCEEIVDALEDVKDNAEDILENNL